MSAHAIRRLSVLWGCALLAGMLAAGCGGDLDPYERMSPLERHIYLEPTPVDTTLAFGRVAQGFHASCMLTADGQAWCWGKNDEGQLGATTTLVCSDGTAPCTWEPVHAAPALRFADFSMGLGHACGIDTGGQAWCWGFGLGGQLGDGRRTSNREPVRVAGNHAFTQIDAGRDALLSCALDRAGAAWCWGPTGSGVLGDGTMGSASVPVEVAAPNPFVAVGAGSEFGCGLDASGQAWCWGRNAYGALGIGRGGAATVPQAVAGGHRFAALAVGGQFACGLDPAGAAWCWGFGPSLGDGTGGHSDRPVAVAGGHVFATLSVGYQHACALKADGQAWCWGAMPELLGSGSEESSAVPVAVAGGHRFRALAAGGVATCGITLGGQPLCWGMNTTGAVGQPNVDP